jgi:hypothetical protein
MLAFNHEVFTCGGIACSIGAARPSWSRNNKGSLG